MPAAAGECGPEKEAGPGVGLKAAFGSISGVVLKILQLSPVVHKMTPQHTERMASAA